MRSMFRKALVATLAVLALGAVAAGAAQAATEAPYFKVAGAKLGEGASKEFSVKGTEVNMDFGNAGIRCTLTTASSAKLLGSSKGNPGAAEMTLELSGCTVERDLGCKILGTIKTNVLQATLVSQEKEKGKGRLEVLFGPKKGSFWTIFKTENCTKFGNEVGIAGQLVAEVYSGGKPVEVGKEPAEARTVKFVFPNIPIQNYWLFKNEIGSESSALTLESGGIGPVELTASPALELAGEPNWGVYT